MVLLDLQGLECHKDDGGCGCPSNLSVTLCGTSGLSVLLCD